MSAGRPILARFLGVTLIVSATVSAPISAGASTSCGTWSQQTAPSPPYPGGWLNGVWAASTSDVWAVGASTSNGSPLVEHYSGSGWALKSAPLVGRSDYLHAISGTSSSSIWSVGVSELPGYVEQAISYHYNGTSWKSYSVPTLTDSFLYGVSTSSTLGAWAVGSYWGGSGNEVTLILKREAPSWVQIPSSSVPGQASVLNDIRMVSPTLGWAVGSSSDSLGNSYPLIEQWNGSTWSIVPADLAVPGWLNGIRASATSAIAVGSYGGTQSGALVETWNGSSWTADTSAPAPQGTNLSGIAGSLTGTEWAVGGVPGGDVTVVLEWDSSSGTWTRVKSSHPGTISNDLNGITTRGSQGWAVGGYRSGSADKPLILHYC